jgi:hypothetical protein
VKKSKRFGLLGFAVLASLVTFSPKGSAEREGVTLYDEPDLEGRRQTFHRDEDDLNGSRIGARRTRSVSVSPGCIAVLYELPNFRGRRIKLREDDHDLANTKLGPDSVSSLRVRCGGEDFDEGRWSEREAEAPAGVTLFRDREKRGPSETFFGDVPDLGRTRIGSRTASSVRIWGGCLATLYELPGYRGRSTDFREDDNNLANTRVGEDTVSSMRVRCPESRWNERERERERERRPEPTRGGVTLYRDRSLSGPSETFFEDDADLRDNVIGARRASSVRVEPGCFATLYELPGFQGRSTDFREDDNNLANTKVGEDTVSSLRVRCSGSRGRR